MKLTRALALLVVLGLAGCVPATATPAPRPTLSQTVAGTATWPPTAQPTVPPGPAPTATPTAPSPAVLPTGTVALYAAGPWDGLELYALAADGTATGLGLQVTANAAVSPGGRWLAYLDGAKGADDMVVRNLQDGRAYTIALDQSGVDVVAAPAFDDDESRLAFVEVAPHDPEGVPWAIVVVDLQGGATRRLRTIHPLGQAAQPPGYPLGWSAQGELLLDTFVPQSEGAHQGLWALTLPESGTPAVDALPHRRLLAGGAYAWSQLSPDGTRLLYLARDHGYTPADYQVEYIDSAVNQLWSLDIASGQTTLLVEVTDGGALGAAAWSPNGDQALFVQGRYSGGDRLGSLTLKACTVGGALREVGPLSLPAESYLWPLGWVRPGLALVPVSLQGGTMELYTVDVGGGGVARVAEAPHIRLVGCLP